MSGLLVVATAVVGIMAISGSNTRKQREFAKEQEEKF